MKKESISVEENTFVLPISCKNDSMFQSFR